LLNTQSESGALGAQNIKAQTHRQIQNVRYVAGTPSESWQRIEVAPGIEIHYHEPLSPSDRKRLEALIILARKIFL